MAHITLPVDVPGIRGPLSFRPDAAVHLLGLDGASDHDIHDTVLITAAFCMYNRYVEGLGTREAPEQDYEPMGRRLRDQGYAPAKA